MKNFLLINPHYTMRHPPLGLGYLASYLNAYYPGRYRFRLVDYAWQTDRDLETALAEFPPDLVGLTATTNTFLEARRIAALVKSRRQVPVIIGGVHITAVPDDLVGAPFDVAVLGEGEETLLELVRHFDETGGLKNEHLQGLAYQEGENLVKTPARPLIADLDRVPRPDYSLFAMEKHYTLPRALAHGFYAKGTSLMPSRGCPYGDCSFCGSNLMWRGRVRFFSPRRVFEEIKFLVQTYRLNSIIFLDDNFTTNRHWLAELHGYVRASEFFPFFKFDCESIAEFLDEEKTRLLKSMGCERIEFGFESGCQRVLSALKNQRAQLAKTTEAIDLCKKHGIKILGNFIFGWFDETQEEILETYDFIQQHPMDYVAWHTLAPYPGTRAWQLFEQRVKQVRPDFRAQDFYNMETCNTHLPLNPALEPAQAHHLYSQMRREAYQGNTQIIHDLHLMASEKAELWQACQQDMNMHQIKNPRIVRTRPNIPQDTARPAPEKPLPSLCQRLERAQPLSTREIMADFELLTGHPWEHHASAPTTTYYACLSALARSVRPRRLLEIGTGFGLSAAALLSAGDGLELFVSLDLGIFGDHYQFPESNLDFASRKIHAWCRKKGIPPERVKFFQANTQPPGKSDNDNLACQAPPWDSIPELQNLLTPLSFDVLFVDGKHTEDGLYQDMKIFWPCLRPGGLLLCDDLHDASYRQFFPWAGETVASFERFTQEFAQDIEEHHIWDYPRVLPEGPAGLRPFGIIRKKADLRIEKENVSQGRLTEEIVSRQDATTPGTEDNSVTAQPRLADLQEILTRLARSQRRLYLRDQTPASLAVLIALAEEFQPTRIVELGTCQGLSLRAWLAARTRARITAIDLSFAALRQSLETAPLDLTRVTLLEQDILKTEFSRLWEAGDRVLLYVDAHDQPQTPIMTQVLEQALPALPTGSLVVVDDLWHSPDSLDPENAPAFFQTRVLPEIDPLQCFPGHYASYWQGGAFMGFAETIPLLTWVNQQHLHLTLHPGAKLVSFAWPVSEVAAQEEPQTRTGSYFFNPVQNFALAGAGRLNLDHNALAALYRHGQGADLFSRGQVREALEHIAAAGELCPDLAGAAYAQAVCHARLGRLTEAAHCLDKELSSPFPHTRAHDLRCDLQRFLDGEKTSFNPRTEIQEKPNLTLFAIPKAFQGHTAVIQKNALESWSRLTPRPEIILFGDDPGTAEIARELHLRHVPDIAVSDHGTPLVKDLFHRAEALAQAGIMAYVNADIILGQDFLEAVAKVQEKFPSFLMVGQRHDVAITEPLDFADLKWAETLRRRVEEEAVLHAVSALDYFVFTKGLWPEIPDLALGRTAWDNWLTAQPLAHNVPVVDATASVVAVHQNHDYQHVGGGQEAVWRGAEARRNQELAWESPFLCYTTHATWELTPGGLAPRLLQKQALARAWEGVSLLAQEDFPQALVKFESALRLLPAGIPGLQYVQALALAGLGRRPEAIEALKTELAPHPTHHPAQKLLESLERGPDKVRPLQAAPTAGAGRPLISVVIPTHNRAALVAEAVNSALNQEFRDVEVVVVDDGSTDNTPEIMARIEDRRLRYLQKPKSNAPDTRNRGIDAAQGEWLLWLDSDDVLLPGWLARLASILEAGAEADVYYGNLEVVDARGRRLHIIRYEDFGNKNAQLLARLVHSNPLPLPGSLMRKALVEQVGYFDVEFTRAHDYEFWTRLAPVARFRHVPFLAVQWRWHDTNMSSGSVTRDLSFEARVVQRLLTRHPLAELFPDLPWEVDWVQAQAQAAGQLGEIFCRYGDQESARPWLQESQELLSALTPVARHAAGR